MQVIQEGDMVRHKTNIRFSGGLSFSVLKIEGEKALCDYIDTSTPDAVNKQEWVDVSELEFVSRPKGGFF